MGRPYRRTIPPDIIAWAVCELFFSARPFRAHCQANSLTVPREFSHPTCFSPHVLSWVGVFLARLYAWLYNARSFWARFVFSACVAFQSPANVLRLCHGVQHVEPMMVQIHGRKNTDRCCAGRTSDRQPDPAIVAPAMRTHNHGYGYTRSHRTYARAMACLIMAGSSRATFPCSGQYLGSDARQYVCAMNWSLYRVPDSCPKTM